jgi:hypothetical protein
MKKGTAWGWTDERRANQAAAIRRWQPWTKSTGPRTIEGKATSSRNADKPNSIRRQLLVIMGDLAEVLRQVRAIEVRRRSLRP